MYPVSLRLPAKAVVLAEVESTYSDSVNSFEGRKLLPVLLPLLRMRKRRMVLAGGSDTETVIELMVQDGALTALALSRTVVLRNFSFKLT